MARPNIKEAEDKLLPVSSDQLKDKRKAYRKHKLNILVEYGLDRAMVWLEQVGKESPARALTILAQLLPYTNERKGVEISITNEEGELLSLLSQLRQLQGAAIEESVLGPLDLSKDLPEGMLDPSMVEASPKRVRNAHYVDLPLPDVPVQQADPNNLFQEIDDEEYDEFDSATDG